jgi:transcriptional regulator GlxA family with amidase domain
LASAGLLDGRRATTHWNLTDRFKPLFPQVAVDEEQMVIDDGDVITTGGVMSWTQLGLRLIQRFASPAIATDVGRFLIVDAGGPPQSFYKSFVPRFDHGDQAIVKVQHWLQRSFGKKIAVSAMAAQVHLGERTFLRRFCRATGFRPTTYLQQLRVESARGLLETTDLSIEQIVGRVGYDDSGSFRRLFERTTGLAPREYRRRFTTGVLVA